jgi:hypothetical protein
LSPDDAGWVLWNICDQYALGRANDPITQHRYQCEFLELVKRNFPERAHWVVSDGTQAISLMRGGFLDFWCECYQSANDTVPRVEENRTARFQSHRANADSFHHVGEIERMRSALDATAGLLEEDAEWPGQQFATVTHKEQMFEFYAAIGETDKENEIAVDIERVLDDWLRRVDDAKIVSSEGKPLFGSWQSFTEDRPPTLGFSVAVHDAACKFARNGRFPAAERLFRVWLDYRGSPLNDYGEALFLLSCWRNGHSNEEIRRMLGESKTISPGYLVQIAPEMAEVIG